jgi:hypothetical protein
VAAPLLHGSLREGGINIKVVAESKTVVNRNSDIGSRCTGIVNTDLLENINLMKSRIEMFYRYSL